MLQGGGMQQQLQEINSGGLQYQKRAVGHSPSNEQLGGINGIPMPGNYFHQRNQSQDVGSMSTGKKPLKNQIIQRKRAAMLSGHPAQNESIGEYAIDE